MKTEGTKISIENKNGISELHGKIKEVADKKDIEITENYLILVSDLKESPTGEFSFNCGEATNSIISTGRFVEIPDDQYQVATVIYDADGKGEFMIYDSAEDNAVKTSYIEKTVDNKKTTGKYININSVTPYDGYIATGWSDGETLLRRDTYKTLASQHKDLHLKLLYTETKKVIVHGEYQYITQINDKTKSSPTDDINYTEVVTKGSSLGDPVTVYFQDDGAFISFSIIYNGTSETQSFKISDSANYNITNATGDIIGTISILSDTSATDMVSFTVSNILEDLDIYFTIAGSLT